MELDDLSIISDAGEVRDGLVIAATAAHVRHTMVGASTVSVIIPDEDGQILTSAPSIAAASSAIAAGRESRRVAVHQVGTVLRIVFEDAVIAALRARREPMMFATALPLGDVVTRFSTEAGIPAEVDPVLAQIYVEGVGRSQLQRTDSWREISTMVARAGGRAFSDGRRLIASTDAVLLERTPAAVVSGDVEPLQSGIDFSIDVAQPLERAAFTVDTTAWVADAGDVIELTDAGPADGRWLVSEWSRTLPAAGTSRVRLTRPLTIGG